MIPPARHSPPYLATGYDEKVSSIRSTELPIYVSEIVARFVGSLWTFVVEEGVEPTNNRAERALRFAVLWRKLMQGTYNAKGDRWVERMLSVRETCRLRGMPTFPILVDAVTSHFHGQRPDVSWI